MKFFICFFFPRNWVAFAFIFFVIFNFITCIVVVLGLVAGFIVFWWTKLSSTCDPSSFSPVKRLSFYLANRQLNSAPPLLHPAPLFFFLKTPTYLFYLLALFPFFLVIQRKSSKNQLFFPQPSKVQSKSKSMSQKFLSFSNSPPTCTFYHIPILIFESISKTGIP